MPLLKISEFPKFSKRALKLAKDETKQIKYSESLHTGAEDDVDGGFLGRSHDG
jgi:hypothetical protein